MTITKNVLKNILGDSVGKNNRYGGKESNCKQCGVDISDRKGPVQYCHICGRLRNKYGLIYRLGEDY